MGLVDKDEEKQCHRRACARASRSEPSRMSHGTMIQHVTTAEAWNLVRFGADSAVLAGLA